MNTVATTVMTGKTPKSVKAVIAAAIVIEVDLPFSNIETLNAMGRIDGTTYQINIISSEAPGHTVSA